MTETEIIYQRDTAPETPFDTMMRLVREKEMLETRRDECEAMLKGINDSLDGNQMERLAVAKVIYGSKLTDGIHELTEFVMKPKTTINQGKLKTQFPGIFQKANPHLSKNKMADIIIEISGGRKEAEETIQKIRPDEFQKEATVTGADLKKNTTSEEWSAMESAGVVKTEMVASGDPYLVTIGFKTEFAAALESQKYGKRRLIKSPEEDDEE